MLRQEHGIAGQLNVRQLDKDSPITSFGKHNRLLVIFDRAAGTIEVREDIRGLPLATEKDRQHVACRTFQRMHPAGSRLVFQRSEQYSDGASIAHLYHIEARRKHVN